MLYYSLGAIAAIVFVVALSLIISALFRTVVPTNMVHIVNTSKGRRVYGKESKFGNTYYAFPAWIPRIGVSVTEFPISNFSIPLIKYAAYDHKRLPFSVDVQAFFVMEDANIVSERVSDFKELKQHLTQIVSGAVRKVCAGLPLEEILASRSELSKSFENEVVDQLKAWGVKPVNSIEFMNIQDTEGSKVIQDIQNQEESRIDRESRMVRSENAREAEAKEIENKRQIDINRQEALQQVGTRTAEKDQAIGISQEQSKQAVAEQARETAEKLMEVKKVEDTRTAEIEKTVQVTQAEARKETEVIAAEAAKTKEVLEAQAKLTQDELKAKGDLLLQEANAKGILAVGSANADSEKQLQMASVEPQITLAKEIGSNKEYQEYLLSLEQIKVNGEVGKAQATALEKAEVHIVSGDGASLGKSLGTVLTGFSATDIGKKLVSKAFNKD